ncbi:MAG: hypothetical protein J5994_08590 [Ruminococcus sp.]|nr:hypothetical protein [Ruminococcus sp.]
MKEKYTYHSVQSEIKFEENTVKSFNKIDSLDQSFRVYENGFLGVHYQKGEMSDDEGFSRARENLSLKRPYPYQPESGVRSRNKCERVLTDKELMDLARTCLSHLSEKYPNFILSGGFYQYHNDEHWVNENGLDYQNIDCNVDANICFKHIDSKDISDGWFSLGDRDFKPEKLYKMAAHYLGSFEKEVELPEEIIVQKQYYDYTEKLIESLNAEKIALGTSLLSGKVGQKVFADSFTLLHDVSDEECWHNTFWDGEGCVIPDDKRVFIENGVVLSGYSDKRTAKKYGVPHTANAGGNYTDIPSIGWLNARIRRSEKTVKELLDGRLSIIPVQYSGGGFNDKGEYVMPVHLALLSDGENILGKLPPFTLSGNMFDMFGKDFIGVGSDNPIFNDKQILVRMNVIKQD